MLNEFSRMEILLGKLAMDALANARVAIFGVGGVGSFAAEAIARAGIGAIDLFDDDKVCLTNINRQLIALHSTIGQKKVEVMKARILDINPRCRVIAFECFYGAENAEQFDLSVYDYIIDAIDTVSSKLILIERAYAAGTPVISCMGAGNKLDPTRFEVSDISQTSVCPLSKAVRQQLRKQGIESVKVVYSREKPFKPREGGRSPGSVAFVPSVAGLIMAGEVIKDITGIRAQPD